MATDRQAAEAIASAAAARAALFNSEPISVEHAQKYLETRGDAIRELLDEPTVTVTANRIIENGRVQTEGIEAPAHPALLASLDKGAEIGKKIPQRPVREQTRDAGSKGLS